MSRYFKFILFVIVLLIGCEPAENTPIEDKDPYVRVLPSADLLFPSAESICSVTIESSGTWAITGMPDWVSVEPESGDDGAEVVISVLDNELSQERTSELTVATEGAETTISVVQERMLNSDYVDMDFEGEGISTHYNSATGELTVTYADGNVPNVKVGSAVVLPADYQFDIRVVESVSTSDNSVTLATTKGNMCNLFRNTSFTLSTNGDTRAEGVDGRPIITPVAMGYLDEEGNYIEVYNVNNPTTRDNHTVDVELWKWHMDFNGATLYEGGGGRLWWDTCAFDAGLNGTFNFSFGEKLGNGILGKVGDLEAFSYELKGSVGVDMLMRYHYEKSAKFSDDRILEKNVIPSKTFTFVVNGVKVILIIHTHLGQYIELGAGGKVDASGGVKLGLDIRSGLSWSKSGGVVPIYEATPHMNIHHPTLEVEASAYAKLSYYPQIEIELYDFIGPWLEPRPYLKERVDAGFRVSTDGENYVGWTDKYFSGLDMRMGLNLDFCMFNWDVWKSDIFNVVDDTLLTTSPQRLTLLSPESGMTIEDDESVDVMFKVEAYSYITDDYWASEGAAVVFETESGELSQGVVLSDDEGVVSVTWSPTAETRATTKTHTLTARLYASNGDIIDEVTFSVEAETDGCDDENHLHAVDLGLSVKWACCNVGADSPEDYGDYFAWGETSPKSSYDWENYLHWSDYNGDGWWDSGESTFNFDISGTQYDAARANWGGRWRMPTLSEIRELCYDCYWEEAYENGVWGSRVTGPNGNSIFLPAAGYRHGSSADYVGSYGFYWSSTPNEDYISSTYCLCFNGDWNYWNWNDRGNGHTVRPVSE